MDDVDVLIVGARCAGSPLAIQLARRGVRVCVLDKARFPSDMASTHIVHPSGAAVLDRLGVSGALAAARTGRIERLTLVYDDVRLDAAYTGPTARTLLSTGDRAGLSLRRTFLDEILLDAAVAAGADVRTGTAVTDLLRDADGRVCGVRTADGPIRSRVVVGADGRASTVARLVGAVDYAVYPAGRVAAWGYFAGAADDAGRLRIGRFGEHAVIASPSDSGLIMAGVVPSAGRRAEFLADRERQFALGLQAWPELAGVLDGATREGPLRIVPDWQGYLRTGAGPGWVLTGDAGNFKDPAAAQGITDALRQSERLAETLAAGLEPGGRIDERLARWWRWRDEDCWEAHWFAADMGAAGPTRPVTTEVLRDVAADEQTAVRFLRVLNRDTGPSSLLTPRRLARATLAALRRRPRRTGAVLREVAASGRDEVRRARMRRQRPSAGAVAASAAGAAAGSVAGASVPAPVSAASVEVPRALR